MPVRMIIAASSPRSTVVGTDPQKSTETDCILKAMIAVVVADGRLNAHEVGLIQKVYLDQTGRSAGPLRRTI